MQKVRSIIENHDNADGFIGYSIDYGPSAIDRSQRERFVSFPQARRFANQQVEAGNSIGVFYIFDE